MTAERYARIRELFLAVLDVPPSRRDSFLAEAAAEDHALREEVEALLRDQDQPTLSSPAGELVPEGSPNALEPGEMLGQYRVEATIGAGGMGAVYRAFDTRLERLVALKVLPLERLARKGHLLSEAKVLASLNHPNIATVYDVVEADGRRAIAMELAPGVSLAAVLGRGPLATGEALRIARQISEGLEAAHERNIVHRDLKPGNVMVGPSGEVKLLDFGLAIAGRPVDGSPDATGAPALTAGVILGTAAYMSPEQAEGKTVDKRSDIWSFGVVLWEMMTGQRLFDSPTISGILADVLRKEIDFSALPEQIPPGIRILLRRCLDRNVKNRLRDIGEARVAIERAADSGPEPTALPPSKRSVTVLWTIALGVALVAAAVLATLYFRRVQPLPVRARFQLQSPPGVPADLQLSPDGRFLAWLTLEGGLARRIWVRPLDSSETRLINEIQGEVRSSVGLFWSHDSSHIFYQSGGKLMKLARTGGGAIPFAEEASIVLSGASFEDGTIIYGTVDGLFRLSADGRTKTPIGNQRSASLVALPDRKFLVSLPDGVFAAAADRPELVRILPGQSRTAYLAPVEGDGAGRLLFVRGARLIAQRFDARRLRLEGEASEFGSIVGRLPGSSFDAFSASPNGVLIEGRGKSDESILTWFDRSGKTLGRAGKPFRLGRNPQIQLSPDDTRALVPIAGSDSTDLWIADVRHDSASRFTFSGSSSGLWSPDGRSIVWAAGGKVYRKASDGSGREEPLFVVPNCVGCYLASWSADSKAIATHGIVTDGVAIWVFAPTGDRTPRPFIQASLPKYWLQFSPDGKYIAYVSAEARPPEVFVESLPLGTGRWQITAGGGDWPVWSRDGKELYYIERSRLMAVTINPNAPFDGSKSRPLFDVLADTRFQVSRDGRFLIAMPVEDMASWGQYTVDTHCQPARFR